MVLSAQARRAKATSARDAIDLIERSLGPSHPIASDRPPPSEAITTERTIQSCGARHLPMEVVCPRLWSELARTDVEGVRHCSQCKEHLYFCATDAETLAHARAGHCIAREVPDPSELSESMTRLGRPKHPPPPDPTDKQEHAWKWVMREHRIADALDGADPSSRECPECSYPVPRWRESCFVCQHVLGRGDAS